MSNADTYIQCNFFMLFYTRLVLINLQINLKDVSVSLLWDPVYFVCINIFLLQKLFAILSGLIYLILTSTHNKLQVSRCFLKFLSEKNN